MNHARDGRRILTATGRVPGRRGMQTRRRLLEEVEKRCVLVHHETITVAEVAQAAETSAATFYHYFPDIAAAAAEVAAEHLVEFDVVIELAGDVGAQHGGLDACRALAAAFFSFWELRPGLIETIVVASRDEDPRFFGVLFRALVSLTQTLAQAVPEGDAVGIAGSLVMMLSLAAARRDGFARDGVPLDSLIDSQARILHASLRREPQAAGAEALARSRANHVGKPRRLRAETPRESAG
jgi:AcrR family transcriptional regulator